MDSTQQYPPGYLAEDRSQQLIHVAIIFGVLETVFVLLFYISRIVTKTANGPEVWLIALGYIACFGHVIIIPRTCWLLFHH